MSTTILATKLYIPPPRPELVLRPRLIELLSAGAHRKLTLISAPAGFGKTTLLSEWAARSESPVAWLSLDEGDDDPTRFWTYLIRACQSVLADTGESALHLLSNTQPLPDETIPTLLINDLAAQNQSFTLVLDDYHKIQNASIHNSLLFMLDHLPHNLHVIVSTRIDPPWPLMRYRAGNQLTEIRVQDLRFSVEEAAEFLNHTMGLDLSTTSVSALEERTEGWVAGLQLAALSIQGRSDVDAFIRDFTGSHRYIAEYLIEEILKKQPDDHQLFLLQTSILDRLNADVCEALTGCEDGQSMLLDLNRANIFLVPLDNEGHWFRYHHLFADLLLSRLQQQSSPEALSALHLLALDWYEDHGFIAEAVHHVLAAGDFERAAALIDEAGQKMIFTDQYTTLRNWLGELPDRFFQILPRLEIYRVLIDLNLGTLDMYEQTLLEKEALVKSLPPSPGNDRLRLEALVYLSLFMAHQNTTRAIQMAQEVLVEIPESDIRLRSFLFSTLYRAYGMEGDVEKAASAYRECLSLALAAEQCGMISNTTMIRAFDLCQYARLDEAAHYCQYIVDVGEELGSKVFYPAGTAYIGLGGICLERNDLAAAKEYLTEGLALCHQGGTYGLYTGYLQKARLHQAMGEFDEALAVLHQLEQKLERRDFTLTARQVSIRLAVGDVPAAVRLIPATLDVFGDSPYSQELPLIAAEAFNLCLARIYIAQEAFEEAGRLLDEIESTVEPGQRFGRLLEVQLLRALMIQKQSPDGISPAAQACLERALELGQPAGIVLLFLEEGPDLIPLLEAVTAQPDIAADIDNYARRILVAFDSAGSPAVAPLAGEAAGLIESLTAREMEVLQLVALGDSNQDIADKLFITVRTAKKHLTNILGKLEVSNRTQAVVRAHELGLIDSD